MQGNTPRLQVCHGMRRPRTDAVSPAGAAFVATHGKEVIIPGVSLIKAVDVTLLCSAAACAGTPETGTSLSGCTKPDKRKVR